MKRARSSVLMVVATMSVMATAGACDSAVGGTPTGAACDPGLELTWDTFGQDFMSTYCVRCHQSFSGLGGVQARMTAIDSAAGAGPDAINHGMPQSGMRPSDDERLLLSNWIACGAP